MTKTMLKKIFLFIIILAIIVAWIGDIFSVFSSPFSLTINEPEKDFLKKAAQKAKNIIYREATNHNPKGDILPDQIDDKIKEGIKEKIN
jgi:hypothetical protein